MTYRVRKGWPVRLGIGIGERSRRIMQALQAGESNASISRREGVSRERVRQVRNKLQSGKWKVA